MSSKKDKENGKNTNSKKRDRPEAKEWQWEDTILADEDTTTMLAQDVKQLLLTRGEEKTNLKGKKIEIIKYLKEKYTVDLEEPLSNLTVKELQAELRLRKLDDTQAKKDILVARLKGEIESTMVHKDDPEKFLPDPPGPSESPNDDRPRANTDFSDPYLLRYKTKSVSIKSKSEIRRTPTPTNTNTEPIEEEEETTETKGLNSSIANCTNPADRES